MKSYEELMRLREKLIETSKSPEGIRLMLHRTLNIRHALRSRSADAFLTCIDRTVMNLGEWCLYYGRLDPEDTSEDDITWLAGWNPPELSKTWYDEVYVPLVNKELSVIETTRFVVNAATTKMLVQYNDGPLGDPIDDEMRGLMHDAGMTDTDIQKMEDNPFSKGQDKYRMCLDFTDTSLTSSLDAVILATVTPLYHGEMYDLNRVKVDVWHALDTLMREQEGG